jgi:steroid 5-alpha reductase family enzyme
MTYMLINKTGKAMMDRRLAKTRGDAYLEYASRTSGLVPLPPRRRA